MKILTLNLVGMVSGGICCNSTPSVFTYATGLITPAGSKMAYDLSCPYYPPSSNNDIIKVKNSLPQCWWEGNWKDCLKTEGGASTCYCDTLPCCIECL